MVLIASVIIPTFNRKDLTIRAINSVLGQSYKYFELIVVNDGSTEDYFEIENLLRSENQHYLFQQHAGVSVARNTGLKAAQGEFIFLLDSDDEWLPNKLEMQIQHFNRNPACYLLQNFEQWVRNGKKVQVPKHLTPAVGYAFQRSLNMCCVSDSSIGFRREVVDKIGYFNPNLRICEDYDYWIRALSYYEIDLIPEVLVVKYSGSHSQLSDSEEALDRFRVYSLFNIIFLVSENQLLLSDEQLNQLYSVLNKKLEILESGARKRSKKDEELIYSRSIQYLKQDFLLKNFDLSQVDQLKIILSLLLQTLDVKPKSLKKSI